MSYRSFNFFKGVGDISKEMSQHSHTEIAFLAMLITFSYIQCTTKSQCHQDSQGLLDDFMEALSNADVLFSKGQ